MQYMVFLLWLTGLPAAVATIYITILWVRNRQIRAIEMEFPNFITSMVEGLRNGEAIETALMAAATTSAGPLRGLTNRLHDRVMAGETFAEALGRFGHESGSRMIERTVGMLQISIEQGAEMAETLERVANDVWTVYVLHLERLMAAAKEARLLLVGGVIMTPAILGLVFGMFESMGTGAGLMIVIVLYMAYFGFISSLFYGIVAGRPRESLVLAPIFIFLALLMLFVGVNLYIA
ncbi:MAG TPA: hypothetical protein EYP43_01060 [Thermoplasmata archaeon]|nr:hypothetical protein [Thermoplasmata archaeon]